MLLKCKHFMKKKTSNILIIALIGVISVLIQFFPEGLFLLYPFRILSTWFHEMGHGVTAMILGGSFHSLEIFENGSGVALFSGNLLFGKVGNSIVAAAGLIGPIFAGMILILLSLNKKSARYAGTILSLIMIISVVFWVRNVFGIVFILIFGIILMMLSSRQGLRGQSVLLQFVGVQAFLSVYENIGYFFSPGGIIGGSEYKSDVAVIAEGLLLPYWFWGGLIIAISIVCIVFTLIIVYKKDLDEKRATI
jgi:hypothetical protein